MEFDRKKYLFELKDNNYIEAVLMEHDYGLSVCVSSQVGCNMGCKFCESGRLKKVRNLETYEMVEQILLIEKDINTERGIKNENQSIKIKENIISILLHTCYDRC